MSTSLAVDRDLAANEWRSVFRQLVARGYLKADADRYGGLVLEEKCRPLLRGDERIELRKDKPQKAAKKLTKTPLPEDFDIGLWEALREHRRELAQAQGVPPFVIFHDSTLQAMTSLMPENLDEFSTLPGVGQRKLEKYGDTFLNVIREQASA